MSNHTPGPWSLHETISDTARYLYVRSESGIVAEVTPLDEVDANARLIAAAPELLGALKEVLPLLAEFTWANSWHNLYAIALAAIAKAEGQP